MKKDIVTVVNKTGVPSDTIVKINGNLVPLSRLQKIEIVIDDSISKVRLTMIADEVDIKGEMKREESMS